MQNTASARENPMMIMWVRVGARCLSAWRFTGGDYDELGVGSGSGLGRRRQSRGSRKASADPCGYFEQADGNRFLQSGTGAGCGDLFLVVWRPGVGAGLVFLPLTWGASAAFNRRAKQVFRFEA